MAFVEKIESVYPKLKDAGGFELLRSGPSSKDLIVINPPASGYTVPFLKEVSGLGQALAYIGLHTATAKVPDIGASAAAFQGTMIALTEI